MQPTKEGYNGWSWWFSFGLYFQSLLEVTDLSRGMCVCVKRLKSLNRCKTCTDRTFFWVLQWSSNFVARDVAGEWSRPAELHLTKLSAVLRISLETSSDVPAQLWLPVVQVLFYMSLAFSYYAISACAWQPAKPRSGQSILQSVRVNFGWVDCATQNGDATFLAMAMATSTPYLVSIWLLLGT